MEIITRKVIKNPVGFNTQTDNGPIILETSPRAFPLKFKKKTKSNTSPKNSSIYFYTDERDERDVDTILLLD